MKYSEYLWKYIQLQNTMKDTPGWSPEQARGELTELMAQNGDSTIESDTTGEAMTQREAHSVEGRNSRALWDAYRDNKPVLFESIVRADLGERDAYHAAKAQEGTEG